MKKLVASVGLAALGASTLQNTSAQTTLTRQGPKPWTVSATLNGFYDDNINSSPSKEDSFGWSISPSVTFGISTEQTTLSAGYTYSAQYYENRQAGTSSHWDQIHNFNLDFAHAFNEKNTLTVHDSFVLGQEPDMLRAQNSFSTFQFVPGDNIRNYGAITLDGKITRQLGFEVGYDNAFYDYADDTPTGAVDSNGNIIASTGGSLNRLDNGIHAEARWEFKPETFGVLGFRYRQVDYTGDQAIGGGGFDPISGLPVPVVFSDTRNSRYYAPYVGVIHTFTPQLSGNINVGANYADYPNDNTVSANWSPYVNLSLKYLYGAESYVQAGFTHDINATDVTTFGNGKLTQDQESSIAFLNVNHRFTPKIYGNLIFQFQDSVFNGGSANNQAEQYYLVGLDGEYRFSPHFSGHVGYNYDLLVSNDALNRGFDRNRVYIGVTASY